MVDAWQGVHQPYLGAQRLHWHQNSRAPTGCNTSSPDQQFANLYWFRADLFARKDLKDKFKTKFGYDLGAPLSWSAYEDIAQFFSNDIKQIDGKPIYGPWTTARRIRRSAGASQTPGCPWRAVPTRATPMVAPSTSGASANSADKSHARGRLSGTWRSHNSAPAVYALTKYLEWLENTLPNRH